MSESSPPSKSATSFTPRPYKKGDVREDGFIFCDNSNRGRPSWRSPISYRRQRVNVIRHLAKKRAESRGIPFDVSTDHLMEIFPKDGCCPIFHCTLSWGDDEGRDNSPSLDRIIPEMGYVEGNVVWMSHRANRIKSDASLAEIKSLYDFLLHHQMNTTRH